MSIVNAPVGRIRALSILIQRLEDKLMGNAIIPMEEQRKMHAEIAKYRKEIEDLEKRTR